MSDKFNNVEWASLRVPTILVNSINQQTSFHHRYSDFLKRCQVFFHPIVPASSVIRTLFEYNPLEDCGTYNHKVKKFGSSSQD